MSSASLPALPVDGTIRDGPEILSPRVLASPASVGPIKCVAVAQREFFRITEVTDKISESNICLVEMALDVEAIGPSKTGTIMEIVRN